MCVSMTSRYSFQITCASSEYVVPSLSSSYHLNTCVTTSYICRIHGHAFTSMVSSSSYLWIGAHLGGVFPQESIQFFIKFIISKPRPQAVRKAWSCHTPQPTRVACFCGSKCVHFHRFVDPDKATFTGHLSGYTSYSLLLSLLVGLARQISDRLRIDARWCCRIAWL